MKCQLPEALKVYSDAASLARDQREIEHIILYEKGTAVMGNDITVLEVLCWQQYIGASKLRGQWERPRAVTLCL